MPLGPLQVVSRLARERYQKYQRHLRAFVDFHQALQTAVADPHLQETYGQFAVSPIHNDEYFNVRFCGREIRFKFDIDPARASHIGTLSCIQNGLHQTPPPFVTLHFQGNGLLAREESEMQDEINVTFDAGALYIVVGVFATLP
ncbi:MAG: hypothetical protein MO853_11950 [Candidatus Protistobacter heckmanni]|nr:hypothetical protein [Candidatus Protistobacter heckmanni]